MGDDVIRENSDEKPDQHHGCANSEPPRADAGNSNPNPNRANSKPKPPNWVDKGVLIVLLLTLGAASYAGYEAHHLASSTDIAISNASQDAQKQRAIATDTEQRDLRAYVTASDVLTTPTVRGSGVLEWLILAKWQNAGHTPTRLMHGHFQCIGLYPNGKMGETNPGNEGGRDIGPGQITGLGGCYLTPAQIISHQAAGFINGVWSTVHYNDVFGHPHISEQCVTVTFVGNPTKANPKIQTLTGVCPSHNCEDEECGK